MVKYTKNLEGEVRRHVWINRDGVRVSVDKLTDVGFSVAACAAVDDERLLATLRLMGVHIASFEVRAAVDVSDGRDRRTLRLRIRRGDGSGATTTLPFKSAGDAGALCAAFAARARRGADVGVQMLASALAERPERAQAVLNAAEEVAARLMPGDMLAKVFSTLDAVAAGRPGLSPEVHVELRGLLEAAASPECTLCASAAEVLAQRMNALRAAGHPQSPHIVNRLFWWAHDAGHPRRKHSQQKRRYRDGHS